MATAAGRAHEPSWLDDESEETRGASEPELENAPRVERSSFGLLATIAISLAIFVPQLAWMALLAYLALIAIR
jgi:hypothetical protein